MKKILYTILSVLVLSISVKSQPVVNRAGNANTVSDGRLQAQYNFFIPRYADTISANLQKGIDSTAALIYTRDQNIIWMRSFNPKRWIAVGQKFAVEDSVAVADRFFNLDGNNISIVGGNFGLNTLVPTETFSIGHIDGDETVVMYTPDGTVFIMETKSGASMQILSNTQLSIIPDPSGGQLVLDGSTPSYINQKLYTSGGGLAGQMGIGVYNALNQETEFYLKAFDFDTLTNYLTLYDKMKFVDIPNDNTVTKLIAIDANDNVRYIDASAVSGALFGVTDVLATANRSFDQSTFSFGYTGSGQLALGNPISGSQARVTIGNPTTATQHLAVGSNFLSNNVYASFYTKDTLTTASFKSTGLYNRYQHFMSASNLTISGWSFASDWMFDVPDTMRLNPVGSDLAAGAIIRTLMQPNTAYTGSHRVQQGLFKDDYVGAIVGAVQNDNTNTTNWIYRRGYSASFIAHYITGGTKDSADVYGGFVSTALNSGRILRVNQFYAASFGNVDSLFAFYAPYSSFNYFYGSLRLGGDVAGNSYAADASAKLDISTTTQGLLIPRMTAVQQAAIISPATYLMLVNTDTARLMIYNGSAYKSVAYLTDIPTGGGGGGTVTDFIFTDGNGFDGTVTSSTTTPTLSLTTTAADTRVMYSTSGAITGSGQFTFTGQALQLASTNTTQTTTSSAFYINPSALTSGTAVYVPTTTLTSGNLYNLVSTSTALASGNEIINVDVSGANGTNAITATGIRVSVTNTNATSGTNVGIETTASGATTANIGIRATPSVYVGAVSVNAVDGMRMKNPGNGNYDGYYVESSSGTTGTTYGYAGMVRGGGLTIKTTSGSISIAPASGSGVYFGTEFTTATARIHIIAGTTTAGTAPLKFTSGTSMTTAEAGAFEFTTDDLFFTITTGAARKRVLMADPVGGLTAGRISFATTNGRETDDNDLQFDGTTLILGGTAAPAGTAAFYNQSTVTRQAYYENSTLNAEVNGTPSLIYVAGTIVEAGSGTHSILAGVTIGGSTVTGAGATVTRTASLYVGGAMSATVTDRNFGLLMANGAEASFSSTSFAITSTSTDITLDNTYHTVKVDATGANRTITLPAAASCNGRIYTILKSDASGNSVTIDGNGGETISGAATKVTTTQYGGWTIQSDASNWYITSTF